MGRFRTLRGAGAVSHESLMMFRAVAFVALSLAGCQGRQVDENCPTRLTGWTKPADGLDPHGWHAQVTVAGTTILWDGKPVSEQEFQRLLRDAPNYNPRMHVLFDPTGATSCEVAERVRDEIQRNAACGRAGLCGQGQ